MAKVMVVDDAYTELQVMETILRSAGHDVLTYLDGDQLEEKIVRERPDVVLLDIVMPRRNGFAIELVEKEQVFFLSNYVGTPTLTRALPVIKSYADHRPDPVRVDPR